MKICRFNNDRLGLVEGETVIDVSTALEVLPSYRWPYPQGDALILHWDKIVPAIQAAKAAGTRHKVTEVRLLSPIANPSKIIGIAGNRKGRGSEKLDFGPGVVLNNSRKEDDPPRMFLKANSALVGPAEGVALRYMDRRNDPEAEFTMIIGKKGTNIPLEKAMDYVFGYSIGMDMTLRGSEPPSTRKSIDSYALLGPWIVTADEIPDPDNVPYTLLVNGASRQSSNTNNMQFGMAIIVSHASTFFTLHPGDVIMAGSPLGFEPVRPGDVMLADFQNIGQMEIRIRAHQA